MQIREKHERFKKKMNIQTMMVWILLFSFTDALFTDIGIRFRWVEEANPFAKSLYDWHWLAFYGFKLLLPAILLLVHPTIQNRKWIDRGILICFICYLLVNLYHVTWMGLGFYLMK